MLYDIKFFISSIYVLLYKVRRATPLRVPNNIKVFSSQNSFLKSPYTWIDFIYVYIYDRFLGILDDKWTRKGL